jgi:hypothetical protein
MGCVGLALNIVSAIFLHGMPANSSPAETASNDLHLLEHDEQGGHGNAASIENDNTELSQLDDVSLLLTGKSISGLTRLTYLRRRTLIVITVTRSPHLN